jgi:phosphoribosylformylglycinamidine cyclo-ligase
MNQEVYGNMKVSENTQISREVYRESGVDTDEADRGLSRLTQRVKATWPSSGLGAVMLDIGYFANVINIGSTGIAMCTDGIGSKAIIAQMLDRYDTVGIDCVAMNVNDLICVGARPLSMVDYIAVQTANADLLDAISIGLCEGAEAARISISGGEISQIRDIITGYREGFGFDLVGMAVGDVSLDRVNTGRYVQDGDVVVGIESNGVHSNGLSLARRAFFETNNFSVGHTFKELRVSLGEELLRPTHIYVREILEILDTVDNVKALVHITSDGLLNLTRVTAPDIGFVIDDMPPVPPIFQLIQRYGDVPEPEMYHVYNMGVGFCVVVSPNSCDRVMEILHRHGRKAFKIGCAVSDPKRQVFVNDRLVGIGKKFKWRSTG